MKELGVVLDVQTNDVADDEVILPMKEINSLTKSTVERARNLNNRMATVTYQYYRSHKMDSAYLGCKT
jgi:hypothetical protein